MFITFIIDYVQLWFLYKNEFHISTAGKHVGTINITLNINNIFLITEQTKVSSVPNQTITLLFFPC